MDPEEAKVLDCGGGGKKRKKRGQEGGDSSFAASDISLNVSRSPEIKKPKLSLQQSELSVSVPWQETQDDQQKEQEENQVEKQEILEKIQVEKRLKKDYKQLKKDKNEEQYLSEVLDPDTLDFEPEEEFKENEITDEENTEESHGNVGIEKEKAGVTVEPEMEKYIGVEANGLGVEEDNLDDSTKDEVLGDSSKSVEAGDDSTTMDQKAAAEAVIKAAEESNKDLFR